MSAPSIYLGLPDWSLFKFPPDDIPPALPPPNDESTFKSPFPIPYDVYNGALDIRVPLTIGGLYVVSVTLINAYNRRNGNKPWWIAKTRPFKAFVVLHNIFLALYSGVTFLAMTRAADHVWPGFDNPNGLAGVADALCKMHGPRGLGDAVVFNTSSTAWEVKNTIINLLPEGAPDPTDVGRLWNEGLAFWGWLFYLSKFYEVLDTFVIVAKGKRSATLQTYHHAGAMLCMWAGIRYMSPPIWMFVWINSAIHTMMYTYFTLSALGIRVPMVIKRTLTTMQITQFLFGATFAATHLFVKYDIPIVTAYKIVHPVTSVLSAATSTVSELAASATSAAADPVQSAGFWKRLLLRAAGEEGVAENVRDRITGHPILPGVEEAVQRYHEETRWRNEYTTINCVDTTGQSFAIWLNLIYLAPLTGLFIRFFVRAYTSRGKARGHNKHSSRTHQAERSVIEAAKGVDREVDEVGRAAEKGINKVASDSIGEKFSQKVEEIKKEAKAIKDEVEDEIRDEKGGLSGDEIEKQEDRLQPPHDNDESADERPSTAGSAPASPSKKKRKYKKKNKGTAGDSTASLEGSVETAKVKEGESFADAVKNE
ncbi:GNS1/SUR4 family-domain-containing protein [Delphinella strobiligena]|nr:GNS1/SUR4 family-domain-containing protein [Delphinella strobiligena]